MFILLLISLSLVVSTYGEELIRTITTSNGKVEGKGIIDPAYEETIDAFQYLGIPYAKPPLGELRFKKPQPADPWKGTLKAYDWPSACPQYSSYPYPWYDQDPGKSEDCLYLNIFTPVDVEDDTFPVILFIHGGGFQVGSNRMQNYRGYTYAFDYGDNTDLIVVTINYRLGALGFLTTGTDDAPGNIGLYDMLMALNWVRTNIKAFHGNPDLITIFGQGAGAIAASLFCVSPLTKGLFHGVMLHSGTFVSHRKGGSQKNRKLSERLAQDVGCISQNRTFHDHPKEIVTCLQGIDANKLTVALNSINPEETMMFYPEYDGELIALDPVQALIDGNVHDVEMLVTVTTDEGSYGLTDKYPEVFGRFGEKDKGINMSFARSILKEAFNFLPEPEKTIQHYLGGAKAWDEYDIRSKTYKALGDERVFCPSVYFAQKYGDHFGKTLFIALNFLHTDLPWAKWMKSTHYSDAPYLLSMNIYHYDTRHYEAWSEVSLSMKILICRYLKRSYVPGAWTYMNSHKRKYVIISDLTAKSYSYGEVSKGGGCDLLRQYYGF